MTLLKNVVVRSSTSFKNRFLTPIFNCRKVQIFIHLFVQFLIFFFKKKLCVFFSCGHISWQTIFDRSRWNLVEFLLSPLNVSAINSFYVALMAQARCPAFLGQHAFLNDNNGRWSLANCSIIVEGLHSSNEFGLNRIITCLDPIQQVISRLSQQRLLSSSLKRWFVLIDSQDRISWIFQFFISVRAKMASFLYVYSEREG